MVISILLGSCYVEESLSDRSGPPVIVAPAPTYYWSYPRYHSPYYYPYFYRPTPPPRPPYRPTPPPPRPNVTPRPSTPNPPPPRPGNPSRHNHKVTYGHR